MTRVIKIGGRPQVDPWFSATIASEWKQDRLDGGLVLVHGGGDEVSTLQSALGGSSTFVDGRRVTTAQDIDIVRMALSGSANKRLVASLAQEGVPAVGVSGEDASLIGASPMDAEKLGFVGVPRTVNVAFLRHLLAGGYLPVISPVSRDTDGILGAALNVNGDDAAAAIAISIRAAELLLIADVPGVMRDGSVFCSLTAGGARELIADGVALGGMRAKLEAGLAAIEGGVGAVRITDIAGIADSSRGTSLCATCKTALCAIGELS
jgi:acetylglutamate kinase